MEVRNRCPLCIAPLGKEDKNLLVKMNDNVEFDNGSLELGNEVAAVTAKIKHLQLIFRAKE